MDQWDELLEKSIAARMAELEEETRLESERKKEEAASEPPAVESTSEAAQPAEEEPSVQPSEPAEESDSSVIPSGSSQTEPGMDSPDSGFDDFDDMDDEAIMDEVDNPTYTLHQAQLDDFANLQPGEFRTVTITLPNRQTDTAREQPAGEDENQEDSRSARKETSSRKTREKKSRTRSTPQQSKASAEVSRSEPSKTSASKANTSPSRTGSTASKAAATSATPKSSASTSINAASPASVPTGRSKRKGRMTSLQSRWLVNSMGAVSLVLILAVILVILLLFNYFYSTMESGLENKAQTAADFFATYETESEYKENAASYVANFGESDSIELEFIDTSGEIIFSSYAYQQTSGVTPETEDIITALETGALASWTGSDPFTGERIMAVSAPVVQGGTVMGVIRMVTSMRMVDRQLLMISLLLIAIVAGILAIIYFTNLYFVKSIAEPIADITETTKRIAAGSYGVQIDKKYNDEIGELVDTINDMSIKLRQSEKVKSEFISSVSHELRTPLTAINGWAETLLRGDVTDKRDVQKGLAIIVSEARRLTKMVEELLEFSRIENGRFTLQIEQIDIKAELEDAVYTYREFYRKKGIALEYRDCEEEFPPIPGDPERLRQVFSNLLDNAAKHGGSGKRIVVSIWPDGDYVAISVRDYGRGIPPDELPYIKTKFYKGSSKARGSGIGLAVSDEIAKLHNGSLDIANAEGGGCIATLRLPIHGE